MLVAVVGLAKRSGRRLAKTQPFYATAARPLSSIGDGGRKLFDSILKKTMRAEDHMDDLLDKEGEAQSASAKSGLDENEEEEWVDMFDPVTREWNGPRFGEPTKFGDWQSKGRATDFK